MTMPRKGRATVLDDLPNCIIIDEILIRLSPKDVLRCRAVQTAWCKALSSYNFLLTHHQHQRSLPVMSQYNPNEHIIIDGENGSLVVCHIDPGSSNQKLMPILRYNNFKNLHAICDGLLIISQGFESYICNPTTRKCAILPMPHYPPVRPNQDIHIGGFYKHQSSSEEYRVLWFSSDNTYNCYILTVGSNEPICIGQPPMSSNLRKKVFHIFCKFLSCCVSPPPLFLHSHLHWLLDHCPSASIEETMEMMMFNTVTETFRWMSTPVLFGNQVSLLEMGNTVLLCASKGSGVTIDVWYLEDYEAEAWSFKYKIKLLAPDASPPLDLTTTHFPPMADAWPPFDLLTTRYLPPVAVLNGRELLIVEYPLGRILHYDINGNLIGNLTSEECNCEIGVTGYHLQPSMFALPISWRLEEDGEEPPFFAGL